MGWFGMVTKIQASKVGYPELKMELRYSIQFSLNSEKLVVLGIDFEGPNVLQT